ncbi:MAG: hypothetical protein J5845_07515 [Lachnospiraceae bacterium]|nr:hypothetical protein [Lachnospiraceae bacterium]
MEEKKINPWIDLLIILGMITLVFLFCQPIGRKWNDAEKEMYTGSEGTFSYDTDTYYYIRKAKEFTEGGLSSISLFNSRAKDSLMTPVKTESKSLTPNLLSALAAVIWFGLNGIGIHISIYQLVMHLCSFLLALFTVPVYFFLKKRLSRTASVLGALIAALAPPFFNHSCFSVFDTDAMIGLLALIIVLSIFECVLAKNRKAAIAYGLIACVSILLLYLCWQMFFVYVCIAFGTAGVGVMVTRFLRRKHENKGVNIAVPGVFLGIAIIISAIAGGRMFYSTMMSFLAPSGGSAEPWPSAAVFVTELESVALVRSQSFWYYFITVSNDFMSYIGGLMVLILLSYSLIALAIKGVRFLKGKVDADGEHVFLFTAIGTWFAGALVMILFGIRYMQFLILPSALIAAFGFETIRIWILAKDRGVFFRRLVYVITATVLFGVLVLVTKWSIVVAAVILVGGFFFGRIKNPRIIIAALFISILAGNVESAYIITKYQKPVIEKPIEDAMIWVRENTPENAVIADFWSLGYIYEYYGERRAIADGGTYDGEFFFWLATMMATDNAKLSAGIARMLQNCGIDGSMYVSGLMESSRKASEIIKEILPVSKEQAENLLREKGLFSDSEIAKVLSYTHPDDVPEIYMVTDFRLVRSCSALSYYRDWDFSQEKTSDGTTMLGLFSVEKPIEGTVTNCTMGNSRTANEWMVFFKTTDEIVNGWIVRNGESFDCGRVIYVKDGVRVYDKRLAEAENGRTFMPDEALIIMEEKGRLSAFACEINMPDSMLLRLYLFNGEGQDTFTKVFEAEHIEEFTGDVSHIQRRIGAAKTKDSAGNAVSVWKISE